MQIGKRTDVLGERALAFSPKLGHHGESRYLRDGIARKLGGIHDRAIERGSAHLLEWQRIVRVVRPDRHEARTAYEFAVLRVAYQQMQRLGVVLVVFSQIFP